MDQAPDLSSFPNEILEHLISYMPDKSQRKMRLANTLWFQLINYRNFTIYLVDTATLPRIVDRLLQYDGSIGLKFIKPKIKKFDDYLSQVPRLTHLTSLEVPWQGLVDNSHWQKFTTLTNLRYWSFSYICPPVFSCLVNLIELNITNYAEAQQMIEIIPKMSYLQRIKINYDCTVPVDFSLLPCPAHLTGLTIPQTFDTTNMTMLYNLKSLICNEGHGDTPVKFSLEKFTALEQLTTEHGGDLMSFGTLPTQLTSLVVWDITIDLQSMDTLARLHNIQLSLLSLKSNDDCMAWISGLTALCSLNLWPWPDQNGEEGSFNGAFFRHITSNKLTQLVFGRHNAINWDHSTHLTSLETVNISEEEDTSNFNYGFISHLTRLTSFHLHTYTETPQLWGLTALHHLKFLNLEHADFDTRVQFPEISLASLTSLERISAGDCSRITLESLSALKHLTFLYVTKLDVELDYSLLKDLPLRELICTTDDSGCDSFYSAVSQLTDLQLLELWSLSSAQIIGLSSLQHLTSLHLQNCNVGVDAEHVTHLTSVLALSITSNKFIPLHQSAIEGRMPNLVSLTVVSEICEPEFE
jgi:hypothetical protein